MGVVARAIWSNDMTQPTSKPRSDASASVSPRHVDAKHLADMLARVHDPVVARVFLSLTDEHPELRLDFLGAQLKATETVEREAIRYEKAREAGLAYARNRARLTWMVRAAAAALRDFVREVRSTRAAPPPAASSADHDTGNVVALNAVRKAASAGQ